MANVIGRKEAAILRKAVKHIKAVPARYDQNAVLEYSLKGEKWGPKQKFPECGTIGCLAGWISVLEKQEDGFLGRIDFVTKLLGLSIKQECALFGSHINWPSKFEEAYENAKTLKQRTKVLEERVNYFIKTGE